MKKPYQPPELRKLDFDELTAQQKEWIREERAKARNGGELTTGDGIAHSYEDGEVPSPAVDRRRAAGL